MINMKKIILTAALSGILISPIAVMASSASLSSMTLTTVEEGTNKVNLKLEHTNSIVKSFQAILKVDGAEVSSIEWSDKIKKNGNANFIEVSDNEVMILVTSTVNLVDDNGNLEIGTMNVTGKAGEQYKVSLSNLKAVSLNNTKSTADVVNNTNAVDFYVGETNDKNDTVKPPVDNENSKEDENTGVKPPEKDETPKEDENTETPEKPTEKPDDNKDPEEDNIGNVEAGKPGNNETIKGDEVTEDTLDKDEAAEDTLDKDEITEGALDKDEANSEDSQESMGSVIEKVKDVATGDSIKYIIAMVSAMILALTGIFAFKGKKK